MKKKRFTEEQIIKILKAYESGAKVPDLSREYGVSEQSIYRWKSKYGGMEVSDAKRLRELEAENAKLKKLLAESMIEKEALKDVLSKKW
jgi:putative transposase